MWFNEEHLLPRKLMMFGGKKFNTQSHKRLVRRFETEKRRKDWNFEIFFDIFFDILHYFDLIQWKNNVFIYSYVYGDSDTPFNMDNIREIYVFFPLRP